MKTSKHTATIDSASTERAESGQSKSARHLSTRKTITPISSLTITQAESQIEGCAKCDTSSDVAFGAMLKYFGADRSAENHSMERSAECPNCQSALTEQTLVSWD